VESVESGGGRAFRVMRKGVEIISFGGLGFVLGCYFWPAFVGSFVKAAGGFYWSLNRECVMLYGSFVGARGGIELTQPHSARLNPTYW